MEQNEKLARLLENTYLAGVKDSRVKPLKGFEKLYATSNEDLVALFKKVDVKGKRVLTVGSSGDQTLYAILNGAREVQLVDLCPYTKLFLDYKIASIKTFSYDQFFKNFRFNYVNTVIDGSKTYIIDTEFLTSDIYKKISHNMNAESREFWDNYFLELNSTKNISITTGDSIVGAEGTYFRDEDAYNKLKKKLQEENFTIRFTNDNIMNFANRIKPDEMYDVMLFSNLIDYLSNYFTLSQNGQVIRKFKNKIFYKLLPHLTEGGVMQVDYLFENLYCDFNNESLKIFQKHLGAKNIKVVSSGGSVLYVKQKEDEQIQQ